MAHHTYMDNANRKIITVTLQVIFWIACVIVQVFALFGGEPDANFWETIKWLPLNIFSFYVSYFVLIPKFYRKDRKGAYLVSVGVVALFVTSVYYQLCSRFGNQEAFPLLRQLPDTNAFIYGFFLQLIIGFWAFLIRSIGYMYKDRSSLIELQRQKEQKELDFLVHQSSPHFFLNALNDVYTLSLIGQVNAVPEAVLKISTLLRYTLYDIVNKNFIEIETEGKMCGILVDLSQLKFKNKLNIELNYSNLKGIIIPSNLLLSLLENAIKHSGIGVYDNSYIYFSGYISHEDDTVNLSFENSTIYGSVSNMKSGGIGLKNLRERLDILYHESFSFKINNSNPSVFCTHITIPLVYSQSKDMDVEKIFSSSYD